MRKKEKVQKNMYELLQWVEAERREHITLFWKCAFNDTITNQYPRLQMLRNSLMDGQSPLLWLYLLIAKCVVLYVHVCVAELSRCPQTRIKNNIKSVFSRL